MIQVKSISKSFEDKTVLEDINFTFENGKTNLIIGQSGSGKTVLMEMYRRPADTGKRRGSVRQPRSSEDGQAREKNSA